jgi:nicotinate phosphoribosyltransferase
MISAFEFTKTDILYLGTLKGVDGKPLFSHEFLKALQNLRLSVNIEAVPEGTIVFPKEPLLRVEGPLWECQLLETILLNLINFPTLVATKAARICSVAEQDQVIEFGLRRAQGPNGGLTASRAAYVGGATATSNVLAGQYHGIPVAGTHAHSWVLAFDDEASALSAYAQVMPNNSILLVDTYNTLEGVRHAINVGLELKAKGYTLLGIRLDSGDLASLSIAARIMLDEAGLFQTKIVGSNDLDEYQILKLKEMGAKISIWGVGTRLATAYDQPALGGVYKLVAIQNEDKDWIYKAKLTNDVNKRSIPGVHQVRRFSIKNQFVRDVLYNIYDVPPIARENEIVEELLLPVVKKGKVIYTSPSMIEIRQNTMKQLERLPQVFKSLNPLEQYPVVFQDIS